MIRALIGVLIAVIAAALIRGVMALITREMGQMMNPEKGGAQPADNAAPPNASTPLRKCKVCDTYIPADRMVAGAYCSSTCQEKSHAA